METKLNDKRIPNMDLLIETLTLTVLGAPLGDMSDETPEYAYKIGALEIIALMEEIIKEERFKDDEYHMKFNAFLSSKVDIDLEVR